MRGSIADFPDHLVDALLGDMPSAHPDPSGRSRLTSCSMTARIMPVAGKCRRIRFVYFSLTDESVRRALYHQYLIKAELLLERVLAARAAGLRAIAPTLGNAAEARATVRPPRNLFHPETLEYRRWYDEGGAPRPQPLTRESLAALLMSVDGLSREEAKDRAVHRSHALAEIDQAWLFDRRRLPLAQRPLNEQEYRALILAIDGIHEASTGLSHVESANRRITLRVAAMLGAMLDEFVAAPFRLDGLNQAFNEQHLLHLRRTTAQRQAASATGVLCVGPTAWFAAKAARMHAEHQVSLAISPEAAPVMRLSGRPVVTVVGGRLRTFVDGWRRGHLRSSIAFVSSSKAAAR